MAATILNRTPLASISFKDGNGDHIRVYYQDEAGNIRETFYDDGNGWALREKDIVGVGRLNTGIAATVWNNGTQVSSVDSSYCLNRLLTLYFRFAFTSSTRVVNLLRLVIIRLECNVTTKRIFSVATKVVEPDLGLTDTCRVPISLEQIRRRSQ